MATYTQANRILQFNSPLGANKLLASAFRGSEAISELFDYEADLLTEPDTVVPPSTLIGKHVTMELQVTDTGTKRYFNGIVASLESTGGDKIYNGYRIRMVPMLWLLSLNRQTRVFEDMTVLEIARKVLDPYSITLLVDTQSTYATLEYCTQYRETDLEFFERILRQQGVFFYFTHSKNDHVLVLSDASSQCTECPVNNQFDYGTNMQAAMLNFYKPVILAFHSRSTLIPGEHTQWDYRFMHYDLSHASPRTERSKTAMGDNSHELYDYSDSAAAFFKTEGNEPKTPLLQTHLQKVARDIADAQSIQCLGDSTASTMQAGFTFNLDRYPLEEKNTKYLATRVTHSVQQWPPYRAEKTPEDEDPYSNTFEARPFSQVYRPAGAKGKPRVNGVVTGKVVTRPGEDSHLDRFGRVCVQFWWDRHRPPETPDNTLLRVAQQWAGKGWGTYFWPRVGDEVLINFIEGDPDAPIVVGSVYNGINMPKYDPKSEYTRSGILTRSSIGGKGANANELRFDDLKGSEQIFMNAERDYDLHVEYDRHTRVDNEEHQKIASNQFHRVGGRSHLSVAEEQRIEVGGDRRIVVRGMQSENVATTLATQVGEFQVSNTGIAHTIFAGGTVNIHGVATVIVEAEGILYLVVEGVGLAITAAGLTILAALGVGILGPPPVIPPITPPLPPPCGEPDWPGDDPRA